MSPFNEEPSCRSLSPRVLSRSRYDAHWLRQASDVLNVLEALATTAQRQFPIIESILLQTLVDHKACPAAVTRLGSWDLPGFRPFQRYHHRTRQTRLPVSQLPTHRFSQPHSRSFVPHDLRVYSTPKALLGSWPSKLDPETIGHPHRTPGSCVVVSSPWLPSHAW